MFFNWCCKTQFCKEGLQEFTRIHESLREGIPGFPSRQVLAHVECLLKVFRLEDLKLGVCRCIPPKAKGLHACCLSLAREANSHVHPITHHTPLYLDACTLNRFDECTAFLTKLCFVEIYTRCLHLHNR